MKSMHSPTMYFSKLFNDHVLVDNHDHVNPIRSAYGYTAVNHPSSCVIHPILIDSHQFGELSLIFRSVFFTNLAKI